MILMAMLGLSSCLKNDSDTEITVYDDTAITKLSFSAVNRYIHTTSKSGTDSVYKKALTVANYPFSIDHYQQKIYNREPLPSDCDLKHVLVSVTTSTYSGSVAIKSLTSDSIVYYSSSDSIDLSQPREFRVFNTNSQKYRAYQVQVNIGTGEVDAMNWTALEELSPAESSKLPQGLYEKKLLKLEKDDTGTSFQLSEDNGATWTTETLGDEEDASLLPSECLATVAFDLPYTDYSSYRLLVGSPADDSDRCIIWRKASNRGTGKWVYLPVESNNAYYLPKAESITLAYFNEVIIAINNNGSIYESRDQGITWKSFDKYSLPADISTNNLNAIGDSEGYLWLCDLDSRKVWRGQMNK